MTKRRNSSVGRENGCRFDGLGIDVRFLVPLLAETRDLMSFILGFASCCVYRWHPHALKSFYLLRIVQTESWSLRVTFSPYGNAAATTTSLLLGVGLDWVHLVRRPLLAYCTSPGWWLTSVEWGTGNQNTQERNLSQCQFVHHKSHMSWPGLEPRWWEARD
jgi:hypothetical protein